MQIKIVCWFSKGKGGDNGVGKWGGGFCGRALNKDAETKALKMIGQRPNLCQHHSPRTSFNSRMDCQRHIPRKSFNSWTDWVPYQIRLRHESTGRFLTINQPNYQQLADPSNRPAVQRTTCLKANGPVPLQVGVQITRESTNVVLHDILEPYTKVQV